MLKNIFFIILPLSFGCTHEEKFEVKDLVDEPVIYNVQTMNLSETAPAYGISMGVHDSQTFEVNVEAEDSKFIKVGQNASVFVLPQKKPIPCKVLQMKRGASQETGQAIARLKPLRTSDLGPGEFVFSSIIMGEKKNILAVPKEAIFIKDGKEWVIKKDTSDKIQGKAVEVSTGARSDNFVEIKSGLNRGDQILTQSALGYLFPDFKTQNAESD